MRCRTTVAIRATTIKPTDDPEQGPDLADHERDATNDEREQSKPRSGPRREGAAVVHVLATPVGHIGHI